MYKLDTLAPIVLIGKFKNFASDLTNSVSLNVFAVNIESHSTRLVVIIVKHTCSYNYRAFCAGHLYDIVLARNRCPKLGKRCFVIFSDTNEQTLISIL
jgi:hypothetical protein